MTAHAVDRCASCQTTIDLDWDAVVCPCGAVVVCAACDEIEACEDCRDARDHGEAS